MSTVTLLTGDAIEVLKTLPDKSVQACITSPPYFNLRSYLPDDHPDKKSEIGTEQTPEKYVARLVEVFREIRRVLRDDGLVFLNLGDSYNGSRKGYSGNGKWNDRSTVKQGTNAGSLGILPTHISGLKPKDLIGIPWMTAFALRNDGWYLRAEICWNKTNAMVESVRDRVTRSHEQVFMLAKSRRYFYDNEAIKEPSVYPNDNRKARAKVDHKRMPTEKIAGIRPGSQTYPTRNKRSVWSIPTKPYKGAHFATFPEALVEPCLLASTSARGCCPACGAPWKRIIEKTGKSIPVEERHGRTGHVGQPPQISGMYWDGPTTKDTGLWQPTCKCGEVVGHDSVAYAFDETNMEGSWAARPVPCTVADIFSGAGTTGVVCVRHNRNFIGIDLNPFNHDLARERIAKVQPRLIP